MLDKMLIRHCAPTLGALKTASLFNYSFSCDKELDFAISSWNIQLNSKGISLYILRKSQSRALIYVCRASKLERDLNNRNVQCFLSKYGYSEFSTLYCIKKLKKRFQEVDEFPHEIGLFLGYPLEDVIGFVKNNGQNFKCTGCWKVYSNECEATKLFMKYKHCKNIYAKLFDSQRKSVYQLTVAA